MPTEIYTQFDWLALITGITAFCGAIGAMLKSNSDRKKALSEQYNNNIDAITSTYENMLDKQLRLLVQPLELRIKELEQRIDDLEHSVQKYKRLFSMSTKYISTLCTWIHSVVDDGKLITKPKLPEELKEHL